MREPATFGNRELPPATFPEACRWSTRRLVFAAMTREKMLAKFAAWACNNFTATKRGQAQIFLNLLFQDFDQQGCTRCRRLA